MERLGPIRSLRNFLIAANLVAGFYMAEAVIMSAEDPSKEPPQAFNYDRAVFDENGKVIFENPTPCGQIGEPTCVSGKFFTVE